MLHHTTHSNSLSSNLTNPAHCILITLVFSTSYYPSINKPNPINCHLPVSKPTMSPLPQLFHLNRQDFITSSTTLPTWVIPTLTVSILLNLTLALTLILRSLPCLQNDPTTAPNPLATASYQSFAQWCHEHGIQLITAPEESSQTQLESPRPSHIFLTESEKEKEKEKVGHWGSSTSSEAIVPVETCKFPKCENTKTVRKTTSAKSAPRSKLDLNAALEKSQIR